MRVAGLLALLLTLPAFAAPNLVNPATAELLGPRPACSLTNDAGTLRVGVHTAQERPELVQISLRIRERIEAGEHLNLSFRTRAGAPHRMRVLVERRGPPYDAVIRSFDPAGPEWSSRSFGGTVEEDWAADTLNLRFQIGLDTGTVELADIRLERAGREASPAAIRASIQPAAVTERIRKHRMAALQVNVRDARGRAVPGARVEVEQQRHAFLFGCNFFGLQPTNGEPRQLAYRTGFTNLFNYATLPFYWGTYERRPGEPDHDRVRAMAAWCHEHHLATKGHPLVWHNVYPRWAPVEPDAAIAALRARVGDLVPRFAGLMDLWDVVNEANNADQHADTGTGAWVKRDGAAAAVGTALGWARTARSNGTARLLYNDFNVGGENVDLLRALEAKGELPDAIGLQSHMHGGPWPIERVWRTAERFAVFGRPIHFTEVTVVSGETRGYTEAEKSAAGSWPSTPEGEEAQAHYVARFYELLFSHPQVEAITWWDFSDHRAWMHAPAGLVRADMSPKPAYTRLHELIKNTWWTRGHGETTPDGRYETRVFRGTHRIRATLPDGRTIETQVTIPWDREAGTAELTASPL